MKKKLIVTILCIALAAASGCGNSSNNTSDTSKSKSENSLSSSNESETYTELLSFDLTVDDFKNDIITVLQPFGYSLSVDDVSTSSTYSFGINAPDNTVTYIHLLLDSNNNISNIDINCNGSDSFLDVAFASIVVTNPASDFNSIIDSLNLKNYATSNIENSKLESHDGITYMFSCGTLSIQRDEDNKSLYVKQPLSTFTSLNPNIYNNSFSDNTQSDVPSENTSQESSPVIPSYSSNQYKVGVDIPAGEYVLIGDGYFSVTSDANGSDIIFNNMFENNFIVTLNDGEYFTLDGATAYPFEQYCASHTIDTTKSNCMLKIGVNLPAGEYKLNSVNDNAYYCIYSSSRCDDIISNNIFDSSSYITVSDGQYLLINDCTIQQ